MLQITIALPLTEEEAAVLATLIGTGSGAPAVQPAAKAPAAKPAAPKAAPKAPEPEATPEAEEDLLGDSGPTLEEVVAKATELVGAGKTATVKAALAAVGVKRVSEVKAQHVADFAAALEV